MSHQGQTIFLTHGFRVALHSLPKNKQNAVAWPYFWSLCTCACRTLPFNMRLWYDEVCSVPVWKNVTEWHMFQTVHNPYILHIHATLWDKGLLGVGFNQWIYPPCHFAVNLEFCTSGFFFILFFFLFFLFFFFFFFFSFFLIYFQGLGSISCCGYCIF